jgi:hypothetical protein
MRHRDTHPKLERWLAAEAHDDQWESEEALRELFATLPRSAAPAGFADRVMARAAAPAPWPLERAALALLLLCGASLGAAQLWLAFAWERFEPQAWIAAGTGLFVRLATALGDLAAVGAVLVKAARWLALAGATPEVLAFLAGCALLAATAGRLLVSMLDERSAGHAQA